jgi:hypothetical protein
MRNVIKYDSANLQPDSIKSGNFNISTKLIPTIPSGFYNGISPIIGGYTIYVNKAENGPSIYSPKNDSELVGISQSLGGIPTTNLIANAELTTYNNVPSDVSSVLVPTSEKYKGATVWKQTLTPLTANGVSWLSNGNNPGIGVYISSAGGGLANRFTGYSIFFKPTVPMHTNPIFTSYSNVAGYQSTKNYDDMGDGWFRAHVIWFDTVTRSDHKFWAINPLSSTLNTPIDIYWAGPFKEDRNDSLKVASFVNGTRGTTATDSLTWLNQQSNMTVVNENYPDIVTDGLILNLDAGFVSSYPKTGTDWKDLSGNGYNGTLVNGSTYSTDGGGSIIFDGVDDYSTIPNLTMGNGNTPWSISAWVKTTTSANGLGQGSIISNSSGGPVYSMLGVNNGKMVYWVYPSNINSWKSFNGNITVNDGNWHLLTWVQNTGYSMDMYVDGILDSTVSPTNAGNNNPLDIVGGSWAGRYNGIIKNLLIYQNKALTQQEVLQNYYAGLQRFIPTDGLVLSLDAQNTNLYATSPTTVYDISGNEKNGTLINEPTFNSSNGGSIVFDGVDDRVDLSNSYSSKSLPIGSSPRTIISCFKTPANFTGKHYEHIVHYGSATTDQSYGIALNNIGSYYISNHTWAGSSYFTNYAVRTNTIYFVAITYNDTSTPRNTFYVNGVFGTTGFGQGKTTDYSINTGTGYNLYLGCRVSPDEYFGGSIYFVQIYDRALTAIEIQQIYNATKSRFNL